MWLGHKDVRGKAGKRDGMVQVRVLRAGAGEGGVDSTPKALGHTVGLTTTPSAIGSCRQVLSLVTWCDLQSKKLTVIAVLGRPVRSAAVVHMWHDAGLAQGGSHGGEEKWSNSGYVLKVELRGFDNGLYVGTEEKRGIKNDSWAFCWNLQMTGSARFQEGEMEEGLVSKCGSGVT